MQTFKAGTTGTGFTINSQLPGDDVLQKHVVNTGNGADSRVLKCPFDCNLEENQGSILSRILEYSDALAYIVPYLSNKDCQELRLVCKKASEITHMLNRDRFPVRIYIENLVNENTEGDARLNFASYFGLNCILSLFLYKEDVEILQYRLEYEDLEETFVQNAQKIVSLELNDTGGDSVELARLTELLKTISKCQDIFINLKKLHNNTLSNLAGCTMPSSIKFFKCQFPHEINICGFENLETIEIGCINDDCRITIENLPNLASLTVKSVKSIKNINISTLTNLKSIEVNENEVYKRIYHGLFGETLLRLAPAGGELLLPPPPHLYFNGELPADFIAGLIRLIENGLESEDSEDSVD